MTYSLFSRKNLAFFLPLLWGALGMASLTPSDEQPSTSSYSLRLLPQDPEASSLASSGIKPSVPEKRKRYSDEDAPKSFEINLSEIKNDALFPCCLSLSIVTSDREGKNPNLFSTMLGTEEGRTAVDFGFLGISKDDAPFTEKRKKKKNEPTTSSDLSKILSSIPKQDFFNEQ